MREKAATTVTLIEQGPHKINLNPGILGVPTVMSTLIQGVAHWIVDYGLTYIGQGL